MASKTEISLSIVGELEKDLRVFASWLGEKRDYYIWQRNNRWMLFNALDELSDPKTGDPNITLIALWDGESGDGPGGTGNLVSRVQELGAKCEIINSKDLFNL